MLSTNISVKRKPKETPVSDDTASNTTKLVTS